MRIERLVAMANDISAFFAAEPTVDAAAQGVANHMRRFWDPRMRRQIVAHLEAGGDGLTQISRQAVRQLAQQES